MIEDLFPKTVGNILDYDAIKLAAKQYVEDVFVNIVQEFADNMTLYTMDAAHLADVAGHVAGDSSLSLEQLLDYINSENIYHECDFVSELLSAFPEGVEYKEFDVTGWGFPPSDFFPFNNVNRSFFHDGTPTDGQDTLWGLNALDDFSERNLLMSRYKGQFDENDDPQWHRKEGRRSSWGNPATWMTSGGFGKPATIHINVDEERTVIEGNGLTAVENWLGTVSNKLPINLYIEIESHFVTNAEPASSSLEGYHMSFPYEEEEGFCTNDPNMAVSLNNATPPTPPPPPPPPEPAYSFIVFDTTTGTIVHSIVDEGLVYGEVGYVLMDEAGSMITVYETGVRTESFYFTANGRNETENTNISHADIPVYLEDGTAPAADTPYNGSAVMAFMDVTGNTKQADGESLYLDNGVLRLDAPDTDEGEQWAALVESKDEFDIECNFGDTITVPSGYRVKSVKSTDAFAFGHGTDSGSTVTVEYYGEDTYSSDISQTDINTSGTPGMYIFQMNRNEFPIWGYKLIPNANVTSLSDISVNQNGNFVKLSGTSSYANTIATNANSYPGLFKYLNSSGTVVPQFFNVPSSLWKFENGTFSWLGNTSSPTDLAYWYYNDAPYAGIVVTLTNEPDPEPPAPSELTAYFTNKGAAATKGINLGGGSSYLLYDSSGAPIDASEYMTGAAVDVVPWTIINMYYFDGSALSSSDINKFNLAVGPSIGNGQLVLHPKSNISSYIYNVFRVVFTKPEPPADYNLKVYGQNGDTISLSIENNFMYVFDEPNNRYIMLNGGTSSTIWEIVSIIDTNGNEVSKESDYIWWINGSNIYYKASPTRPVTAAYILLKATPPIS